MSDSEEEQKIADWKEQLAGEMSESEEESATQPQSGQTSARTSVAAKAPVQKQGSVASMNKGPAAKGPPAKLQSTASLNQRQAPAPRKEQQSTSRDAYDDDDTNGGLGDSHDGQSSPSKARFKPRENSPMKGGGLGSLEDPRITELKVQVRDLIKKCEEKDKELARLRDMEMALKDIDTLDTSQQRVVELAKRNKNLTVSLEKERTKNARLIAEMVAARQEADAVQLSIKQKEKVIKASKSAPSGDNASDAGGGGGSMKGEKELKAKVEDLQLKLTEARSENFKFKTDLQKCHRALVKEVGEDVPLFKVLEEGAGGWKGRAQIIALLKTKIKKLERGSPAAEQPKDDQYVDLDDFNKDGLDALVAARGNRVNELTHLLAQKEEEMKDMKLKTDGIHSRVTALTNDNKRFRDKIKVLLDKSNNDDALIGALKDEVDKMRSGGMPKPTKEPKLDESERYELERYKLVNREQENQIDRQEQIVMALRAELQKLQISQSGDGGAVPETRDRGAARPGLRMKK